MIVLLLAHPKLHRGQTTPPNSRTIQFQVAVNYPYTPVVYVIDGIDRKPLTLQIGNTYTFTHPTTHPFRFSTTPEGTHGGDVEYTTGVTTSSGSTVIEVTASTVTPLYYYCSVHSGMGGSIYIE